ncbi:uncharacterized protein PAF06_013989 [Gastrophryne carolinensis]
MAPLLPSLVSLKYICPSFPGPASEKNATQLNTGVIYPPTKTELELQIDSLYNKIQALIPNAPMTYFNRTSSARKSKAFVASPKNQYCIGEDLVVRLDMYDHLGNWKAYGGDFLRPRFFSPDLGASVSGVIEDFSNGSYNIHFPLYWEGKGKVSILLFYPSEGVAALWRARHASLGVLGFHGKFEKNGKEARTICGFRLDKEKGKEICEYTDPVYEEAFYCYKVPNFTCESLNQMRGFRLGVSYLTADERQLFQSSNIAVEIPMQASILVSKCSGPAFTLRPKCGTGMASPYPSGYYYRNIWNPIYCNMSVYKSGEDFMKCLQGKRLFLIGDSTLRQFIMHFTEGIHIVKYFRYHEKGWSGWAKTLEAMNMEKDIYVSYKRHGFPLEHDGFYYFKEDLYTSRQIDQRAGGKDTIFVITMGQHFRQFPIKIFIKRALNIRRAVEKLFARSPDTKVIIKSENTRETYSPVEIQGDFHGYTQYLVLREVFQGLNVGFVDAWDMTVASATAIVHPGGYTFANIMSLTFSFAYRFMQKWQNECIEHGLRVMQLIIEEEQIQLTELDNSIKESCSKLDTLADKPDFQRLNEQVKNEVERVQKAVKDIKQKKFRRDLAEFEGGKVFLEIKPRGRPCLGNGNGKKFQGLSFSPCKGGDEFTLYKDTALFLRKVMFKAMYSAPIEKRENQHNGNEPHRQGSATGSEEVEEETRWDDVESIPDLMPNLDQLREKSKKFPPLNSNKYVSLFLQLVQRDLREGNWTSVVGYENLTREERKAMQELEKATGVIIRPSDKGGNVVLLDEGYYIKEIEGQLSDTNTYRRIGENPFPRVVARLRDKLDWAREEGLLAPKVLNYLNVVEYNIPVLYTIPKVHKCLSEPPGRPIVSGNGGPLERVARFVDENLKPLVKILPSFVLDSNDLLRKLRQVHMNDDWLLASIDVESLYTSIPHTVGLEAVKQTLEEVGPCDAHYNEFVVELLEFVLTNNYFRFNRGFFHQIRGTAMGAACAPSYACLHLGRWESLEVYGRADFGARVALWLRYIDDILVVWKGTAHEFEGFVDSLNHNDRNIRLTYKWDAMKVEFLDLLISKQAGKLFTTTYRKPTAGNTLLHFSSHHPGPLKRGIPFGQFLRIRRNCSSVTDYLREARELKARFRERGYPHRLLRTCSKKALEIERDALLEGRYKTHDKRRGDDPGEVMDRELFQILLIDCGSIYMFASHRCGKRLIYIARQSSDMSETTKTTTNFFREPPPPYKMKISLKVVVIVAVVTSILFIFFNQNTIQVPKISMLQICNCAAQEEPDDSNPVPKPMETDDGIEEIFKLIDKLVPKVTSDSLEEATCAEQTRSTILNPKEEYCVGDTLVVWVAVHDYYGRRKKNGGDYLRARIHSSATNSSASGRVIDQDNGTYLVKFPLFWEGVVYVSILLMHPREAVSALWQSRNKGFNNIKYTGNFTSATDYANSECGFQLDTDEEVCSYVDKRDKEAFYCVKPKNYPCEALTHMNSINREHTYLMEGEQILLNRSNVGVEVSKDLKPVRVVTCGGERAEPAEPCRRGRFYPIPSGYFSHNVWHPVHCNMSPFTHNDKMKAFLQGKKLFLMGDSTVRQYIRHFAEDIQIVDYFNHTEDEMQSWQKTLLAINLEKFIYVQWKKHTFPFISKTFYSIKEDNYMARQIDQIGGGENTIIILTLGQHFRPSPFRIFIKSALNVRRAVERLLIRSPRTRVIIKEENAREMDVDMERFSDFHGHVQYLALREIFKGLNVGFVDALDMSIAYGCNVIHPPVEVLENLISMSFTLAS